MVSDRAADPHGRGLAAPALRARLDQREQSTAEQILVSPVLVCGC